MMHTWTHVKFSKHYLSIFKCICIYMKYYFQYLNLLVEQRTLVKHVTIPLVPRNSHHKIIARDCQDKSENDVK